MIYETEETAMNNEALSRIYNIKLTVEPRHSETTVS